MPQYWAHHLYCISHAIQTWQSHTHKMVPILHSDCINWKYKETDHMNMKVLACGNTTAKQFLIFSEPCLCTVLFFAFYTHNFKGPQACHIQNTQSLEVTGQHISKHAVRVTKYVARVMWHVARITRNVVALRKFSQKGLIMLHHCHHITVIAIM